MTAARTSSLLSLQIGVILLRRRTAAVSSVLCCRSRRAAVGPGGQVGQLRLVVRVSTRVAGFVAALAAGRSLPVAGTLEQVLQRDELVWRHGQLLFVGQHRGPWLVGNRAVLKILPHRERWSVKQFVFLFFYSNICSTLITYLHNFTVLFHITSKERPFLFLLCCRLNGAQRVNDEVCSTLGEKKKKTSLNEVLTFKHPDCELHQFAVFSLFSVPWHQ